MKLASVGLDNLPNVYIDNITLINTSNMPESGIKTEIEITLHDSVDKHWSADPLLMKFMKIIVVQSTSPVFSSRLTAGSLPLEPRAFTRDPNYSASSVDYKIIDIKGKLNPEHGTDTTDNKILVYRYKLGFQTNSRPTHLNYYVATYIDIQQAMSSYNIASSSRNTKPMVGPVSSESVLRSGKTVQQTTMFLLPSGEVWSGPVHNHPDSGYMAGSVHSSRAHSKLEIVEVRNTKIKELTKKIHKNKKLPVSATSKALFSDLWISRRKDASNRCLFTIDMISFIIKRTRHGKALLSLDRDLFDSFMRSVRISKIAIERFRVQGGMLNTKKKKEIILSRDNEAGRLLENLLMNKRGDLIEVPLANIDIDKKEMKNGDSVEDFLFEGAIRELYLFGPSTRSFEFADYSAARGGNSNVAYSVSVKMIDKSTAFIKNILRNMTRAYNEYQNYLESASTLKNYDFKLNRLKDNFIKQQNEKFAIDSEFNRLKQAPWIKSPEVYVKHLAMLRDISEEERIQLKEQIYGMINPTDFKIQNGRKFSRDFRVLISKYIEFFDVKGVSLAKTSAKTSTKSSKQNKTVEHHHMFKEIYSIREDRMYDFLNIPSTDIGMLRVDKSSFDARLGDEISNYTAGGYSTGGDAQNIDTYAARALADTSGNRSSFLSPVKLIGKRNSKDISFRRVRNKKSKEEINKFMNRNAPPMPLRTRIIPAGLTTPNPDQSESEDTKADIEDKFLDAKETLGTDSPFTQFSGSVLPPNIANSVLTLNEQSTARASILNRFNFTKIKTTTSFDLTGDRNKIAPILNQDDKEKTTQRLKSMPTQVKSLFFRRSRSSSNDLLSDSSDVLENPETANMAELNFMTIQKIEFLHSFSSDKNQRMQINKPVWRLLTSENYQEAVNSSSLCRMSYYEDEGLDISIDEEKKLPVLDQYFVLSDEKSSVNNRREDTNASPLTDSAIADIYLVESKYDIKYATSNIVRQPTSNRGVATDQPVATPTTTVSSVASAGVSMAGTTSPMGGSGY